MEGKITRVAGPVVMAKGLSGSKMYEMVRVGKDKLIGEIVRLVEDRAEIQVYEDTGGLRPGEPVETTGSLLYVELGPGLIGQIYDGIQRPLTLIRDECGDFIMRGVVAEPLLKKSWSFEPKIKPGDRVVGGDTIGEVPETELVTHKVLVPPNVRGTVRSVEPEGDYTADDVVATVETDSGEVKLTLKQKWPVRIPRPYKKRLDPTEPLITGTRILDFLFPIAKGGTAAVPGGFGTGKTVLQHQLAKWSDASIVVYVGCGERGNEMTDVLRSFPKLKDPRTGKPLMERTILIANTSNMPVAAREASIYTGITLAEYYRDMGYDVALMADSTSRWAEALREVSGRLGEIPGEEGYPPYLADRLAEFYERAGRVICLGSEDRIGSVTVVGAVSPPGGDFSEPVTQSTLRIVRVFWALDKSLAEQRHFPAISWLTSYSLYSDMLEEWFKKNVAPDWGALRTEVSSILQRESELSELVKLIGADALPEKDRLTLYVGRLLREDFLMQNAFHEVDTYSPPTRTYKIAKVIIDLYKAMSSALNRGASLSEITSPEIRKILSQLRYMPDEEFENALAELRNMMKKLFGEVSS